MTGKTTLILGNSLFEIKKLPENSIDSVVTDPPYGLTSIVKRFGGKGAAECQEGNDGRYKRLSKGFMNQDWDGSGIEYNVDLWKEVLRVLKPGGHLLAFGGTRTYHRMVCAIEDSGFEIRDCIQWLYGSGFPKSHDVGNGWGTSLKPANEPICLARKQLSEKTVKENFNKWGVGAINIDESRIKGEPIPINKLENWSGFGQINKPEYKQEINNNGRWPSNVILDEEAADVLDSQTGILENGGSPQAGLQRTYHGIYGSPNKTKPGTIKKNYGGASRFFYCAKASQAERNSGIDENIHPTVKPVSLMKYLIKLITPPGGIVLDPFMGSGTTGCAAVEENYSFVGIEKEQKYLEIAEQRIQNSGKQPALIYG